MTGVPLEQSGYGAALGFAGEWHDEATGLQYLRARWYEPATGRFTQVDPFGGVLSAPQTQHPYLYGLNNPVNYIDPSGESVALLLAATALYSVGGAAYWNFVPDVQQGFTGWHLPGYIMGYENIRQDWKTLFNPCIPWPRKLLAGLDAAVNFALGVSMVYGFLYGALHAISVAKNLLKAGPASHSMFTLGEITIQESILARNPFRIPGTKNILVPPGYLNKGKWRSVGALAHEIAHIHQEFGTLGKIFIPLQRASVLSNKGIGILSWPLAYLLNPVEIQAAASGTTNLLNLAWVTIIKPFEAAGINAGINDYNLIWLIRGEDQNE